MEIAGKRVLVTGANRGLGRALVVACADAGAQEVVAAARRPEATKDLQAAAPPGTRITPVRLDVTSDNDVKAAAAIGRVDILINNAGVVAYGGVLKGRFADFREEIEVNYFGVLRMVRAFASAMVEHGDGMIVNVASILAKVSLPVIGTYCATKAALLSLSQAMRGDLADHGVRVITVLPGTIDTDMSRGFEGAKISPEQAAQEILEAIRQERIEALIGEGARGVNVGLSSNPLAMEKEFSKYRV